jgi:hypothetical protein
VARMRACRAAARRVEERAAVADEVAWQDRDMAAGQAWGLGRQALGRRLGAACVRVNSFLLFLAPRLAPAACSIRILPTKKAKRPTQFLASTQAKIPGSTRIWT